MSVPANPKIYHIVHIDRLNSIVNDGCLWSDSEVLNRKLPGTQIGMKKIKERRLKELLLTSHRNLHVGECVPFYFCHRSIMLYMLFKGNNPELGYVNGQDQIIHLVADLHNAINWSEKNALRWAFTLSNAGAYAFEDRNNITQLGEINWDAVQSVQWSGNSVDPIIRQSKQAEFLVENRFPWSLFERIGVNTEQMQQQVKSVLSSVDVQPQVSIERTWYY